MTTASSPQSMSGVDQRERHDVMKIRPPVVPGMRAHLSVDGANGQLNGSYEITFALTLYNDKHLFIRTTSNAIRSIDGVGEIQKTHRRVNQRGRKTADGVAADPLASCAPDACANFLHSHHERVCEEHRPEQAISKQRAGLRVRGNAARVVVGGASKQSRAEHAEQPRLARFNNGACLHLGIILFQVSSPSSVAGSADQPALFGQRGKARRAGALPPLGYPACRRIWQV